MKFIAELGGNTNQDIGRTRELIHAASSLGFWGVKLQHYEPLTLYANPSPEQLENLKLGELSLSFISQVSEICTEREINLGVTPFITDAVPFLADYVDFFKISSFDIHRENLIEEVRRQNKFTISKHQNKIILDDADLKRKPI